MKKILCAILTLLFLLSLTACKEETAEPVAIPAAETTEALREFYGSDYLEPLEDHMVTVGFLPTNKNCQYVAIEDQEAAVAAFE